MLNIIKKSINTPFLALKSFRHLTTFRQLQSNIIHNTKQQRPFDKVLIANRGEIACKIIEIAKNMGMKTVAVYSDIDRYSKHVSLADEAIYIGNSPSCESYQNVKQIVDACIKTNANAVHPGYGFLSENWDLQTELRKNGIFWCGPEQCSMKTSKDKLKSKLLAKKANVNTIPGFDDIVTSYSQVVQVSNQIGYPVIIKSVIGSGGRCIRIANNDKEAIAAFNFCQQEALLLFGDTRIFVEKLIRNPKHIEIQLLSDEHGHLCAFPERECSIQRRNQKVIEESPSISLPCFVRDEMLEQAKRIGELLCQQSAATIEMLVDDSHNFYFLGINPRLQVEHQLSEVITGVNIIEQMFWIAAGARLPRQLRQSPLPIHGHAIECRVYSEDPYHNFLPIYGQILKYTEPIGEGIYCESGILEGSVISLHYDPLLCKLVTWGETRDDAIQRMNYALDHFVIRGIQTNIPFLQSVIHSKRFQNSFITTNFINQEWPGGWKPCELNENDIHKLLATTAYLSIQYQQKHQLRQVMKSYCQKPIENLLLHLNKKCFHVSIHQENNDYSIQIDDRHHMMLDPTFVGNHNILHCLFDGESMDIQVDNQKMNEYTLEFYGVEHNIQVYEEHEHKLWNIVSKDRDYNCQDCIDCLISPLNGIIESIDVQVGQHIQKGDKIGVIHSFDMDHDIYSSKDVIVSSINKRKGDSVHLYDVLMDFIDLN
ncbi:hypothetical protein WA158_002427 [Blastocystis sp. Blastoise]